jgi:bacitracin synthase 3
MGGDSIKTIQVVSRLNKVDINIEISDLFQFPTVQGLVDMITARQSARPGYDRLKLENLARLSPIQKWFFSLDLAENNNFILSQMVDFKFDIKHDKLLSLLKILIQSTDSFSSYFSKGLHNDFEVTVRDINESSIKADRCSVPLEEIDSYIEQYSQCIDIISGPLVVVLTFDLLPKKLFLACHHLVMDPISIAMFLDTLATLFSEVNEGSLLRILPFNSYYKWAETLYAKAHTPEILAEFPYWYTVLSCFEGVKNPVKRSDQSEYYQASCIDLNPEAYSILKDYSISIGLGMEKLLIALLLRAMGQCFDYHQVGLMIESTGRDYENNYHNQGVFLSQIMGWMTIRYPVMFSISEGQSFDSLALSVDRVLSMVPNKGLGYGLLRYLVSDKTVISLAQLREPGILFNYLGEILEPEKTAEWQVSTEQPTLESAQKIQCVSTIEINCQVRDGSLNIDYLFDAANISEGHAILLVDTYRSTILGLINQLSEVSCSSPHVLPVSAAQEGILYHCMANPSSGVYHTQTVYVIEGNIEPLVMGKAWQFLMSVYPALRASFIWDVSHQPGQIIANDLEACFSVLSYEGISEIDQKMRLEEFLAQDSKVLFCLDSPPLWRVAIIKLSAQKYWMLWSCHHVIIDGWSSDLVLKNLSKVYDQLSMGHLPDVPRDNYEQYLKTFSSNSELLAIDYWKHYLLRVDFSTQLSATMPSQEASSRDIFRFSAEQIFSLGTDVVIKLRTALKDQNITMSTLIQYAWAKVLSFYCQQDTVVFGAVVSGRHCEIENVEDVVGCLINIVPIIVAVGDIKNCADLLSHQINFMASLKHSQVSLAKILSLKQKITLFDTIMIFQAQKASDSHDDLRGLQISQLTCNENTEYAITLGVNFVENQLHFKLRYRPAQFSEEQIQGISSYLSSIIVYIAHSSDLAGGPSLWANNAYSNKWLQWNNRELLIPKDLSLKSLVMEQMRARAVQVAIIDEKKTYTYQQLHEDSQALVLALSGIGLKKGDSLAVGLPRSYEVVVVIIALLKMGIVYVPINAHYPLTRIRYIIENSQCKKLLLLDVSDAIPELNGLIHYYSDLINARGNFSNVTLAHDEQPFDGLCVFYTSGSTGNPKGVSISNKSMLTRVMWAIKDLAITTNDKLLHHCEPTFDIGLGEVLFPLLGGATLVIMPAVPKDSYSVVNFIRYTGVTVIHILPSFLEKLLEEPKFLINDSVRLIACGGELVTQKLCARVLQRRKIALHILYGPTEAAISVTCLHVHQQRAVAPNSIGFPIDNCQVFIADSILNPLPFGVTGEIYIMGPCVALGYINNSDETKLRFYQLRQFPGKAIYQTGDLGRYLSDGQIQFVGRRDNQVKLRGHRIELGEIESAIITHPLVNSVRVLLKKEGEQDKLLAFVVPTALEVLSINHERLINDIKESLSLKLPSYFLPSHILLLHDLPLTPNDKIDDQVLLNMPLPLCRDKVSTAAINLSPIEESIIKIAEKVLGTIGLNIFDNFFAVGGCSLVAMTFCRALRELGYDNISINLLYQHPRLKDLCSRLETPDLRIDYRRALVHVTPMNVGKPLLCLIHPVSGLIEDYKALASCNINYDVYAIANPGFAENVLFTSLEEMATAYISILEHIPCHENIRIGGWSFGGVVAYEMARQMRERSFRVDSVILIDSYPPSHIDFKIGVDSILSQASGLQGQQVDLLRQEMEANKSLLMSYVPQPLDVKMAFLKADAIDFTGGSNAATPWDGLVSQVNVYPLSARHLQLFAANNVGELVLAVNSIDI